MTTFLRNAFTGLSGTLSDMPRQLSTYDGVLCSAAGLTVLAVGFLGVTTFTVILGIVLSVTAGLYNFYFNATEV